MSGRKRPAVPRAQCIAALGCAFAAFASVMGWCASAGTGADAVGPIVAQPVLGAPGTTLIGSSTAEAPGETWGIAQGGTGIMRRSDVDGWEPVAPPVDADGRPIADLQFAAGALAGRTTSRGGVLVAAQANANGAPRQLLVLRDPGGAFHEAPDASALLHPGETLLTTQGTAHMLAVPVDEADDRTGALVVPAEPGASTVDGVLRFDASAWTREPICLGPQVSPCQAPGPGFQLLAIDASSDRNAWLLAKGATPGDGIVLLARDTSGAMPVWRQRFLGTSPYAQAAPAVAQGLSVRVAARSAGQPLVVTERGLWVDAQLTIQGTAKVDATLFYTPDQASAGGRVTASWCDVQPALAALCTHPLGAELPAEDGRSFAWPDGGPYGQRVITGTGAGALLTLDGDSFTRIPTTGGDAGTTFGAAFGAPDEGWLGTSGESIHVTRHPEANRLQSWPVPFRRPLTAIAPEPGVPIAALASQALAVGDEGQVARYVPGRGWTPEYLLSASGSRARPRLRSVAWPEPDRAYAVGDHAEMWLWRSETGLWEPDPAKPPNFVLPNLTGIAFDPANPARGYVVGKQGVLMGYGKAWTQEPLPAGIDPQANFSSIAFAGSQALVTYKLPLRTGRYGGGLLLNDGSEWRVDTGAAAALDGDAPERVAGLPDGGAVVAAIDGRVIERDGPSAPWQVVPGDVIGYPAALAAIREDGQVRAVAAVEFGGVSSPGADLQIDSDQLYNQPPPGQAPLLTDPYPLPSEGYLLRQGDDGWRDEEHEAFPRPQVASAEVDWPLRPDAVLALLLDPSGAHGWAVGGETGELSQSLGDAVQTAGVMRYPADAAPPTNTSPVPLSGTAGMVSFAVGGNAQCTAACADLANTRIGPEAWLPAAVGSATQIAGLRGFLYSGPGVADDLGAGIGSLAYARESDRYAARLASAAGSLPVFAAPTASDLDATGSLATFAQAFASFDAPLGAGVPGAGIVPLSSLSPSHGYYTFDSTGADGTVRVIVLDYSKAALGSVQQCWLAGQLAAAAAAGTPAIVLGNRDVSASQGSPTVATDGDVVVPILVTGAPPPGCTLADPPAGASAYLFDYPEQNRTYAITSRGRSIPTFGSGTLGYVDAPRANETDFTGASGFLLAAIDVAHRDPATNVAPVTARLIPSIADLALDATDGTLLRRSQPVLFDALARRPEAGMRCSSYPSCTFSPDPYIAIPNQCQGPRCASGLFPEYRFSSSRPDIADFVRADSASPNPRHVLLDAHDRPIPDASSGLLCPFNAGTTVVTIAAGGLSYSQELTVQPGSVQRPCGTVPLKDRPAVQPSPDAPPPPGPAPEPSFEGGATLLPPPPAPHVVKPAHQPAPTPLAPVFIAAAPGLTQVIPVVPPPAPTAARPTPPSGTSPVYQSAVAPESQREEEVAFDLVHNMSARRPVDDRHGIPPYLPALVLIAAASSVSARNGRRRRGPERQLAYVGTDE